MKKNCPYCQGEIIIETNCCVEDRAVSGIYSTKKYAAKLQIDEQKEAKRKTRQVEYQTALEEFTTEYCKDRSLIKNKLGLKIVCIGIILFITVASMLFYIGDDRAYPFIELIRLISYESMALIASGFILFMLEDYRKDYICKIFLKNNPEYEDIFKT
jgi:hypothetical protein